MNASNIALYLKKTQTEYMNILDTKGLKKPHTTLLFHDRLSVGVPILPFYYHAVVNWK